MVEDHADRAQASGVQGVNLMSGNKGFGDVSVWVTGTGGQFPNRYSFAALREDGSVVTWGRSTSGGNSSAVAGQLDVQGSPAVRKRQSGKKRLCSGRIQAILATEGTPLGGMSAHGQIEENNQ